MSFSKRINKYVNNKITWVINLRKGMGHPQCVLPNGIIQLKRGYTFHSNYMTFLKFNLHSLDHYDVSSFTCYLLHLSSIFNFFSYFNNICYLINFVYKLVLDIFTYSAYRHILSKWFLTFYWSLHIFRLSFYWK